ncbi:MAG: hypothetical protein ACI3VN_04690 [Candidatus Onthomonas sp.]
MKNALRDYRTSLKKLLCCCGSTRRRLLAQFDQMSSLFLEEHPNPSSAELIDAFGTPKELASQLMEEVSEQDRRHYRHRRRLLWAAAAAAALLLSIYSLWAASEASHPVEITEKVIIYEEVLK